MKTRQLVTDLVVAGLILWAHAVLLRWLAGQHFIATLLSPNGQVPYWQLLLAVFFVLLRVVAIVILPGYLIMRAAQRYLTRRDAGDTQAAD
jgi:hypothetical protein